MISDSVFWTDTNPLCADDLFSLPMDVQISEEFNKYSTDYDKMINEEISLLPESECNQISPTSSTKSCNPHLICVVCGASAIGYNFDQITCESCKAFFRRSALKTISQMRCRFSGSCVINVHTRRQCTYCRLKKCFDMQMRKDWIRTEEEKELRQLQKLAKDQKKLDEFQKESLANRSLVVRKKKRLIIKPVVENLLGNHPGITINCYGSNKRLSEFERALLNNIANAYQLGAEKADCSHIDRYNRSTTLCQFINDENVMHVSLIYFFKSILDFKQLDIDDQIFLIKNNLVNIIHLHHIIIQNFEDDPRIGEHMSSWIGVDFHNQMADTRRHFYRFCKYPLLLKLTLATLIFSINSTLPRGSSKFQEYNQRQTIFDCQNRFTTFLWTYLTYLFDEKEAIKAMEILVTQILRYQNLMILMEGKVRPSRDNNYHELMQSIFGLI